MAIRLEALVTDVKLILEEDALQKIPPWLLGWQSPWKGRGKGGELISKGEVELYQLGVRIRDRFPTLFGEEYHPDTYHIRATQVIYLFTLYHLPDSHDAPFPVLILQKLVLRAVISLLIIHKLQSLVMVFYPLKTPNIKWLFYLYLN